MLTYKTPPCAIKQATACGEELENGRVGHHVSSYASRQPRMTGQLVLVHGVNRPLAIREQEFKRMCWFSLQLRVQLLVLWDFLGGTSPFRRRLLGHATKGALQVGKAVHELPCVLPELPNVFETKV
jgi:hypothetical protein